MKIFINGDVTSYDCNEKTMTVGELISYFNNNFSDDDVIYIRHDDGYSFTALTPNSFECD